MTSTPETIPAFANAGACDPPVGQSESVASGVGMAISVGSSPGAVRPGERNQPMRVSVVIHNLNRASALEKCLESIAVQTYRPLSVHVLDAGSTDMSPDIAREALTRMDSLGIVGDLEEVQRAGVSASRNLGARRALGDIICFMDNDAALDAAEAIERLVAHFECEPSLGLVHFRAMEGDSGKLDPFAWVHRRRSDVWAGRRFRSFTFAGTGFAVRRDAFWEVGGFWEHIQYSREEEDLSFGLIDHGYEIWYAPDVSIRHYFDPVGRVGMAERRALEFRNGVKVFWRRLPLLLAIPATLVRLLTVSARTFRDERRFPTDLLGDLRAAAQDWKADGLERRPITYRGMLRYLSLHLSR